MTATEGNAIWAAAGVYEGTEWLHVVIGMTEEAYERKLAADGEIDHGLNPDMHRHPILDGLTHSHGRGRELHGHHPVVSWGPPVFLREELDRESDG